MSSKDKIIVAWVVFQVELYPKNAKYFTNLGRMYSTGLFSFDSILAELKRGL